MTEQERSILTRINKYSEQVMGNIDPQKTQVSVQLENLRPIFVEIAAELDMPLEDFFIMYMDLQTQASVATENKLRAQFSDLASDPTQPFLFR
ncbi:MAG: hypothetical protein R3Y47_04340 [Lachnospiraceae bacterium]